MTTCASCGRLLMPRTEVADQVREMMDLIIESMAPGEAVLDRVYQLLQHVHPMIACTLCGERTEASEP